MPQVTLRFAEHQRRYEAWARERFTAEQLQALVYDEAGYPEWTAIEDLFRNWILDHSFTELDDSEIRAALFLIARSWDIGVIVAWLSEGPQLSNLGTLSEAEVLFLARHSLTYPDPDIDDARSQIAVVLGRVTELRDEAIALLLRLYESNHEYTRRRALCSLSALRYPEIVTLIERSWTEGDDLHRSGCLHVLATHVGDEVLLQQYLARAQAKPGPFVDAFLAKRRAP